MIFEGHFSLGCHFHVHFSNLCSLSHRAVSQRLLSFLFFVSYANFCSPQQTGKVCMLCVFSSFECMTSYLCLFVGIDIIYVDLCLTSITELRVSIMADGLGWVGLRNMDTWPSLRPTSYLGKFQVAISPQGVIRSTKCLVLWWGFGGRRVE